MPVDLENLPTTELAHDSPPEDLGFVLVVVDGPADNGKRFVLDPAQGSRFLVGQSPACAVQLADRTVSRRHIALDFDGRDLKLTDLGSTNGTDVEAPRVHVNEVRLDGGELIRVGATTLRIDREVVGGGAVEQKRRDPLRALLGSSAAEKPQPATRFGRLIGVSPAMQALYPLCERLAASDIPVIIEGETGTGKEVLAECLHEQGPRSAGPFIVFDCTAVPPSLVESELFGHEKGAFTGAVSARKGVFEEAHGGTLLIDEIGDLEKPLQAKLLRALERYEVRRVGGNRWIKVDVRVISATRRDLDRAVQEGTFRDDLFHRLAVGRIELPPLRRRHGDIEALAAHFCSLLGRSRSSQSLPPEVIASWSAMPWPGNARELRNAVARYLALGDLAPLSTTKNDEGSSAAPSDADLVERILAQDLPLTRAREVLVREFEQRYVARVLGQHGGVVTRAAAASGIARRHFQRLRARSPVSDSDE